MEGHPIAAAIAVALGVGCGGVWTWLLRRAVRGRLAALATFAVPSLIAFDIGALLHLGVDPQGLAATTGAGTLLPLLGSALVMRAPKEGRETLAPPPLETPAIVGLACVAFALLNVASYHRFVISMAYFDGLPDGQGWWRVARSQPIVECVAGGALAIGILVAVGRDRPRALPWLGAIGLALGAALSLAALGKAGRRLLSYYAFEKRHFVEMDAPEVFELSVWARLYVILAAAGLLSISRKSGATVSKGALRRAIWLVSFAGLVCAASAPFARDAASPLNGDRGADPPLTRYDKCAMDYFPESVPLEWMNVDQPVPSVDGHRVEMLIDDRRDVPFEARRTNLQRAYDAGIRELLVVGARSVSTRTWTLGEVAGERKCIVGRIALGRGDQAVALSRVGAARDAIRGREPVDPYR